MTVPARRPTMRDVAVHAGVSFKTVSRVVNGEGTVSPAVVSKVVAAIEVLGYQPDDRARRLRQGGTSTGVIGFILVDVANPFFSSLLRGIEETARQRGNLVVSGSTDGDLDRQDRLVEAFVARRVDGLIVVPSGREPGALRPEIERRTPMVFVDLEMEGGQVDIVRSDHLGGAVVATQHLLARGHRHIAFFGDDVETFSAQQRIDGFHSAMKAAGVAVDPRRVVTGRHSADEWRSIAREHLAGDSAPTAVFTAQNFVSIGTTHALHDLGLQHRIAQVGFDDVEFADLVQPGITVVPQQPRKLGVRAAELLFQRIGGDTSAPHLEVIANPLVERGSGEIEPSAP
jgi:LacI family transcriptional regulator